MKKLFTILLCTSLLFANAFDKDKNESTTIETALKIVLVPVFVGALVYQAAGALVGYPFRIIAREIKELEKENHQED
ncbi:hypothetical protein [Sulfurimonas sp.]|uniref:hypothetical protein n=1 Tax=Sulfurimonas sp. TaxID=2022749 RepID=UPI0025FFFF67|nr:hypothetical protein [Sulfurimonas sp.]